MEEWMKKIGPDELVRILLLKKKIEEEQEEQAENEGQSIIKARMYAPVRRKSSINHLYGSQKRVRATDPGPNKP